jgi:hypothetical protein
MTPETPKKKRRTYEEGIIKGKQDMLQRFKNTIKVEEAVLQEEQYGIGGILKKNE